MTASVLARHGERIAIGAIDMVGPEPPGTDADRGRRQGTQTGPATRTKPLWGKDAGRFTLELAPTTVSPDLRP